MLVVKTAAYVKRLATYKKLTIARPKADNKLPFGEQSFLTASSDTWQQIMTMRKINNSM